MAMLKNKIIKEIYGLSSSFNNKKTKLMPHNLLLRHLIFSIKL